MWGIGEVRSLQFAIARVAREAELLFGPQFVTENISWQVAVGVKLLLR